MVNPLDTTTLVTYLATVATVIAIVISRFIKPAVESIPALSPTAPNKRLHDAVLQVVNLVLTIAGVLIYARLQGQLTLDNWLPMAIEVALAAMGAHGIYHGVKPSAPTTNMVSMGVAALQPAPYALQTTPATLQPALSLLQQPAMPTLSMPPDNAPIAAIERT